MNSLFEYAIHAIQGARPYQEDSAQIWIAPQLEHRQTDDGDALSGVVSNALSITPVNNGLTEPSAPDDTHHGDTAQQHEQIYAVAVLADGMGGHAGGAQASQTACSVFPKAFASNTNSIPERLSFALTSVNAAINYNVIADPALAGMGCTLVGVCLGPQGVQWISVGDSPLYHYRDGKLTVLNEDHSMAPVLDKMAERGDISAQDARTDRRRNFLRSAVSGSEIEMIDHSKQPLTWQLGDYIIIASDGIATLDITAIESVVKAKQHDGTKAVAGALVAAVSAQAHPHQDNMSVVVIRSTTSPLKT